MRENKRGGGGSCYHWLFQNGGTYTHRPENSITGDKWYRPKQTHKHNRFEQNDCHMLMCDPFTEPN